MKDCQDNYPPSLYGDLLHIVQNAILVINSSGDIIFANSRAAMMFATKLNQLQGLPVSQLFMEDDRDILVNNILHITRKEGEFEGESMLLRRDDTTFQGLIAATAFQWNNEEAGLALSIHDISEMKVLERTLRKSERLFFLGRMLDDISHQIRNPVMVIGGLSRRINDKEPCSKRINAIQQEASYLEALLDSINSFIRLPKPCLAHNTMGDIIAAAESNFRDLAENHGCTWQGSYEDGIDNEGLIIDIDLILKALEAMVINACESYPAPTPDDIISFTVERSAETELPFAITISDQGSGINAEQSPHIFSQFYTNKTKHIGMGLTFAQKVIEEQMGQLEISSTPDQGTTATIRLVKERRRPIRTTRLDG